MRVTQPPIIRLVVYGVPYIDGVLGDDTVFHTLLSPVMNGSEHNILITFLNESRQFSMVMKVRMSMSKP